MERSVYLRVREESHLGDNAAENSGTEPCPTRAVVLRGKSSLGGMASGEKVLRRAAKWPSARKLSKVAGAIFPKIGSPVSE